MGRTAHKSLFPNFNKPRIKLIKRISFSFNQRNPLNPRLKKLRSGILDYKKED